MNCLLIYYTGTFNTRYITNLLKERLEKENVNVETYEIDCMNTIKLDLTKYDLVGLGYPIYGFNTPKPFLKFIKAQSFPKGIKTFIYKNSGETYHANDASSMALKRKILGDKAILDNEYHFIMPYNIHFRFDEKLIKEMLEIDDMLLDILVKEVLEGIKDIRKYKLIHKLITLAVRLQYIGGNINSFFYRIDKDKCINCNKCMNNCPVKNIYKNKKDNISFHHHCIMCMRCSLYCPKDAIKIGLFNSWRVNGPYNFNEIRNITNDDKIITDETKGFFKCYIETYNDIKNKHLELFGEGEV